VSIALIGCGEGGSVMGDLIAFRSQRPSGQARPSGAGAEILFFTGVRYQRMTEDPPSLNAEPQQPQQGGKTGGPGRAKRRRRE
jgi:hypothetical protein